MGLTRLYRTAGMLSTSFGFMIEKRSERGLIYRRGWGVVDVGVEVGGGLLIELEIREDV